MMLLLLTNRISAIATTTAATSNATNRLFFQSTRSPIASATPVTKRHGETRILQTHPLHLFRIIQDVDQYQDFLPLCSSSHVYKHTIQNNGRIFEAKLKVGKPPLFSEEYVSRVTVEPEHWRIRSESISSVGHMFDSLNSSWQLQRVDTRTETEMQPPQEECCITTWCHVDFFVEMTVSDPMMIRILDTILIQVAGRQVEAFEQRCQELPCPVELIEQIEATKQQLS